MNKKYTISAFSENAPGILYRLADLFLRRKINIESLTVSETEQKGISRFTITVRGDSQAIEKVVKQIYRIIEISKVYESEDKDLIFREIALIKVTTKLAEKRREIAEMIEISKGKITNISKDYLVVEQTGSEEEIKEILKLLRPYGLKEFVRSGRIAIRKEESN